MLRGRRGPIVVGAAFALVVVLMIFFLVLPKMGQVGDGRDELAAAQAEQGTLESQLIALSQAEATAPEAEASIREADQLIPPTADPSGFLLLIKNAATQSAVTLTTLTPGIPVLDPETGLSTISVSLEATGSYFSLTEFLYRLETLPRAAKVESVSMAPDGGTGSPDGTGTTTPTVTTGTLRMQSNVVLFTTDANAGPGSDPAATTTDPGTTPVEPGATSPPPVAGEAP